MIFAIGDVHGCAFELRALLNRLPITPDTLIVFVGDYIDRGPNSREVIDTILELREYCRVVTLMGNHEEMLMHFLEQPGSVKGGMFIYNGGSATLASYADGQGGWDIPRSHLEFLRDLSVCYESDHHFFVHAGIPDVPIRRLDPEKHRDSMLWMRGKFLSSTYRWEKVVVHGHTPVQGVHITSNRINVDTGCVFMRRLSAIALPGHRVFSVPRQRVVRPVYLRDPRSQRQSVRFRGALPVEVQRGPGSYRFETRDYSEVGMLIRDLTDGRDVVLQEGERIQGVIGSLLESRIAFEGIVVRCQRDDEGLSYGVKITRLTRP